ncbi:MAG: PH domain-containing protein [Prolixibacteraceae bacterium]|nr:PH domain-containing protein [Prolixibacteraceae bacterium]MBN2774206.1 PH domain-containing protein [Prolixibacteraceae bacterium]
MENFNNSIVLPENLPAVEKKTFTRLEKKYLQVILARIVIFFLIFSGAFIVYILFSNELPPRIFLVIAGVVIFLFYAYTFLINIIGFRRKGYLVRENDISYQTGIITYRVTTVPFNRIQHVEVNQGVLAKLLKLATIKIFTAGGNASDLSVPGLPVDIANNLKSFLAEKISEHE